jgi:5'-3' exonuclease
MKVHVVDGTYELFRAFFGAPKAVVDGREVGATRALFRSMCTLLAEDDVTHVGIAFDTVIESFRNTLFHGYKTGDGIDPDLFSQFPLAERAMRALGLVTWSMIDFECDDALATMAKRACDDSRVDEVVICSPDKDLGQCVRGTRVVLRDRMRQKTYDEGGITEKLGVPPRLVPDFLALTGDAADGIPGIPRFGEKSAAKVLNAFGSLDAIPLDEAAWGSIDVRGKKTLIDNLASRLDDARLYQTLATLREDVPLKESIDDLRFTGPSPDLEAFLVEIGDVKAKERVPTPKG